MTKTFHLASAALAFLLLALATFGSGATHGFSRDVIAPAWVSGVHPLGYPMAYCDDGEVAALFSQVSCQTGGVNAIIDISSLNADRTATFGHYASGTCYVYASASMHPDFDGQFSAACGVDRDDDGLVTDGPIDDFAHRWGDGDTPAAVPVCLRADQNPPRTDPNFSAWDDLGVFIAANVPRPAVGIVSVGAEPPSIGTFEVDVVLTTVTDLSCTPSNQSTTAWS